MLAGLRILVVEDMPVMGRMIQRNLEHLGHTAELALDLAEARSQMAEADGAIDLVMTDYDLPDGNGWELAAELKAAAPDLPVILITGSSVVQTAGPADVLLPKPFTRADLETALNDATAPGRR